MTCVTVSENIVTSASVLSVDDVICVSIRTSVPVAAEYCVTSVSLVSVEGLASVFVLSEAAIALSKTSRLGFMLPSEPWVGCSISTSSLMRPILWSMVEEEPDGRTPSRGMVSNVNFLWVKSAKKSVPLPPERGAVGC